MKTYREQADNFLSKHGITFKYINLGSEVSRIDPKHNNYKYYKYSAIFERFSNKTQRMISVSFEFHDSISSYEKNIKRIYAYDILASLTKYNPCMFSDFCMEYGYDEDSRKAFEVYTAVCKEWRKVSSFFEPEEIEEMREIQ